MRRRMYVAAYGEGRGRRTPLWMSSSSSTEVGPSSGTGEVPPETGCLGEDGSVLSFLEMLRRLCNRYRCRPDVHASAPVALGEASPGPGSTGSVDRRALRASAGALTASNASSWLP